MKKFVIIILLLVAAIAAVVQYAGMANKRKLLKAPDAGSLIPDKIPGWIIEDKPIANTPEMQSAVEALLNFDSGVLRSYRKDPLEISIYIAYWLPAKAPAEIVDAHTPDVCWVHNGWKMQKRPALPDQPFPTGPIPIPNVRQFEAEGTDLSVVYWHLTNHQIRGSGAVWHTKLSFWPYFRWRISQFLRLITSAPSEQLFIRVSANKDIAGLMDTPPLQACFQIISDIRSGDTLAIEKK